MRGHNCTLICADDTHGTPIMINAKKQGITPEQLIAKSKKEHLEDFQLLALHMITIALQMTKRIES